MDAKILITNDICKPFMLTLLKERLIKRYFLLKDRLIKGRFLLKDRLIRH